MNNWQPIETAPKDGTEVLLAGQYAKSLTWDIQVGRWLAGRWRPYVGEKDATHWMPLPPPPMTTRPDAPEE